jgi:CHAT domain-containing protein
MDTYKILGQYQKALDYGRKALLYFRRTGNDKEVGAILNNIGNVYHHMDNNRLALRYYRKARDIFTSSGGTLLAIAQFNMANVLANMNRLKEAEELYRSSAAIYKKAGMKISEGQAYYAIAYLYFLQDRFTAAIKLFEQVHERFTELGENRTAFLTQMDMAEIDIYLNQYGSALMLTEQLIPEFRRLGMRYEEAKTNYFAFEASLRLGHLIRAAKFLRRAGMLFGKEDNQLWLGMIATARSRVNLRRKKYKDAFKSTRMAIRYFRKCDDQRRRIDSELVQLDTYLSARRYRDLFDRAEQFPTADLAGYQRYKFHCLLGKGYYRIGEYQSALNSFQNAVTCVEKMLSGLYPDELRIFFSMDKYYAYRMMVECLLKLGRPRDSFMANLRGLAMLNSRVPRAVSKLKTEVPEELINQQRNLKAALKRLEQPPDSYRGNISTQTYSLLEQKLWRNERKIRSYFYPDKIDRYRFYKSKVPIEKLVGEDETIICYMNLDRELGAFCVERNCTTYIPLKSNPDKINDLIRKLQFVMESTVIFSRGRERLPVVADGYLSEIYDTVFKPLKDRISGNRLIIFAEDLFGQVPFIALNDPDSGYLLNTYTIHRAVSPREILQTRHAGFSFSSCQNAAFAAATDNMPAVNEEARQIGKYFPEARLYIDDQACQKNLFKEIGRVDGFLHIAAHASRASENPIFSRILLQDGPFFPFDLFENGIKAKLVTLSGCQTAAPGLYYGNSFSLAKAFYQAGSKFVLATLWPVADRVSLLFMSHFYRSLKESEDIGRAYLNALRYVKNEYNNPAFWGAFILLGL